MASSINAITTGSGGVVTTADNSGDLNIQSGGSTKIAVTSTGVAVTGLSKASLPTGSVLQVVQASTSTSVTNSTAGAFEGYNGTAWGSIGGGATGGGGDTVFQENSLIVTTSYTLSTGKSAMSVGPITINGGAAVTIPSGYSWLVL